MIPIDGKGNYRLEPGDWWSVFAVGVVTLGSMIALGKGMDMLRQNGERETKGRNP